MACILRADDKTIHLISADHRRQVRREFTTVLINIALTAIRHIVPQGEQLTIFPAGNLLQESARMDMRS